MHDWLTARPFAHRGLHGNGAVENTATAFRAALAGGYAVECDIQISADGEAMVHHDDALGRLTEGADRLAALPAEELKRVAFTDTADRMLTLGELCALVAGRAALLIEIKSRFDGDLRLSARAASILGRYQGPAALMSFDPAAVAAVREVSPAVPRGLVGMRRGPDAPSAKISPLRFATQALLARPQFVAYRVADLTTPPPLLARHLLGLPLLTWTVRTAAERAHAARHADQIIFEGFRP
jgi:glycerophosphoryl diester phosphodiesterase